MPESTKRSKTKRVFVDCRTMPSEKDCSLTVAGREEEVLAVAVRHAVEDHGHENTRELRSQIRSMLREEETPAPTTARKA